MKTNLSKAPKMMVLSLLAMSLSLSGCVSDKSTPENVLTRAYVALLQDNLRDFRATLSGDLKKDFRKLEDLAPLKEMLSQFEGLEMKPAELIGLEKRELRICDNMASHPRHKTVEAKKIYTVQIVGTPLSESAAIEVLQAEVGCAIAYSRVSQRGGTCYRKGPTFCSITRFHQ